MLINPDGYKIKNLTISSSEHAGLFGEIVMGYIDGIVLENVYINNSTCKENKLFAGGIAANIINQSVIRNCKVQGTIISHASGGIVALSDRSYILNCSFEGTVESISIDESFTYAGGIAGKSVITTWGLINNCNVLGTIIANNNAGGIIGKGDYKNCTFSGKINNVTHQEP